MPENLKAQLFALAGVFVVCMIGVAYHAIETRRIRREKAKRRNVPAPAADHA